MHNLSQKQKRSVLFCISYKFQLKSQLRYHRLRIYQNGLCLPHKIPFRSVKNKSFSKIFEKKTIVLLSLVFLSEVRFSLKIPSMLKSLIQTLFSSFQLLFDSTVSSKILPSFSRFCFQSPNEFFYFVALSLQKMCCFVKNSVNIFFY